ncbi:SusD/RagB family nutrient-binding outer membrane lipoprotein [Marinilabiliaceae bacterium JC017]|nr:SusD/RagB family nutrient-binding outer membrane lipoprotein [Marinilabiliaceae bacterium JC017]
MKNKINILLILFAFGLASCESWIDSEINVDPNQPTNVPVSLILPSAQAGIAYSAGGELSRYTGYWVQHITGISTHARRHETYGTTEADVENLWKFYTYGGTLMDLRKAIDQATEEGSPHYSGVGKVMMAYKLGVTTDMWGSVPYEDAFLGDEGNITAEYQTQEEIYGVLFTLLNEAIAELDAAESLNSPLSDDLIYRNTDPEYLPTRLAKWKKAAYSLKARFSIHLSKVKGDAAYTDALAAIPNAFASNDDNMSFRFGTAKVEEAPLYQYLDQRGGYIGGVGKNLVDLLKNGGDTDPRLPIYAKPKEDGTYEGFLPGASDPGESEIGEFFAKADALVNLVTYAEVKFIEAEAYFSKASPEKDKAAEAYNDAVKASLAQFGVSDSEWESRNAAETGATITLDKIMKGKYLATFLQDETFSDWRRHTDIFNLQLAAGAKTDEIPRRFPYPQSEREYNVDNMPGGLTLTDRNWWDEE